MSKQQQKQQLLSNVLVPPEAESTWKMIGQAIASGEHALETGGDPDLTSWAELYLPKLSRAFHSLESTITKETSQSFWAQLLDVYDVPCEYSRYLFRFFVANELVLHVTKLVFSSKLVFYAKDVMKDEESDFLVLAQTVDYALFTAVQLLLDLVPLLEDEDDDDDSSSEDNHSNKRKEKPCPDKQCTWFEYLSVMCELKRSEFAKVKYKISTTLETLKAAAHVKQYEEEQQREEEDEGEEEEEEEEGSSSNNNNSKNNPNKKKKKYKNLQKKIDTLREKLRKRYALEFFEYAGRKAIEISSVFTTLRVQANVNSVGRSSSSSSSSGSPSSRLSGGTSGGQQQQNQNALKRSASGSTFPSVGGSSSSENSGFDNSNDGANSESTFREQEGEIMNGTHIANLFMRHHQELEKKKRKKLQQQQQQNSLSSATTTTTAAAGGGGVESEKTGEENEDAEEDLNHRFILIEGAAGLGKTKTVEILCLEQSFPLALIIFVPLKIIRGVKIRSITDLLSLVAPDVLSAADRKLIVEAEIPLCLCCDGLDEILSCHDAHADYFLRHFVDPKRRRINAQDPDFSALVRKCDYIIVSSREERSSGGAAVVNLEAPDAHVDRWTVCRWSENDIAKYALKYFTALLGDSAEPSAIQKATRDVVTALNLRFSGQFSGLPLIVNMVAQLRADDASSLKEITPSRAYFLMTELNWRRSEKRVEDRLLRVAKEYEVSDVRVTQELFTRVLRDAAAAGHFQLTDSKMEDVTAVTFRHVVASSPASSPTKQNISAKSSASSSSSTIPLWAVLLSETGLLRFESKHIARYPHRSYLEYLAALHTALNPELFLLNSSSPTSSSSSSSSPTKSSSAASSPLASSSSPSSPLRSSGTITWNQKFATTWILLADIVKDGTQPLKVDAFATHVANVFDACYQAFRKTPNFDKEQANTGNEKILLVTLSRICMTLDQTHHFALLETVRKKHGFAGFVINCPRFFLWLTEIAGACGNIDYISWMELRFKSELSEALLKKSLARSLDHQDLFACQNFVSELLKTRSIPISLEHSVRVNSIAGTALALAQKASSKFEMGVFCAHLGLALQREFYDVGATLLWQHPGWKEFFPNVATKITICQKLPRRVKIYDVETKQFIIVARREILNRLMTSAQRKEQEKEEEHHEEEEQEHEGDNNKKEGGEDGHDDDEDEEPREFYDADDLAFSKIVHKTFHHHALTEEDKQKRREVPFSPKKCWDLVALIRCNYIVEKVYYRAKNKNLVAILGNEGLQALVLSQEVLKEKKDEKSSSSGGGLAAGDDCQQEEGAIVAGGETSSSSSSPPSSPNATSAATAAAAAAGGGDIEEGESGNGNNNNHEDQEEENNNNNNNDDFNSPTSPNSNNNNNNNNNKEDVLFGCEWMPLEAVLDILNSGKNTLLTFDVAGTKHVSDAITLKISQLTKLSKINFEKTHGRISDVLIAALAADSDNTNLTEINVKRTGGKVTAASLGALKLKNPELKVESNF